MRHSEAHNKSFLYSIRCMDTANMSLSVVLLLIIITYVSGDTDSIGGISNKVTCRDVMKEMRSLFEQQEVKFMSRFEQIERNQNSMQEQINSVAMIVRSLEQGMASVQYDVREMKSVKLANITTSVRSLEQGLASVQFDLREVKSVTLGKLEYHLFAFLHSYLASNWLIKTSYVWCI